MTDLMFIILFHFVAGYRLPSQFNKCLQHDQLRILWNFQKSKKACKNFRLISLVVSEIDAFKETYRDAILCIFLGVHDFSHILDGCKFCTIKDKNFKFSGNTQLLVLCSVHRKEHLTVHYGWSGDAMKTTKIYLFLCERLILAFCFTLLGFF